jgi:hypothetical protein
MLQRFQIPHATQPTSIGFICFLANLSAGKAARCVGSDAFSPHMETVAPRVLGEPNSYSHIIAVCGFPSARQHFTLGNVFPHSWEQSRNILGHCKAVSADPRAAETRWNDASLA